MGVLCNCPVGDLPSVLRDTIIPLVQSKIAPPRTNDLTRPPAVIDAKQQKRYPGGLAHVVSGVFHSVVANRRQRILYNIGQGVRGGGFTSLMAKPFKGVKDVSGYVEVCGYAWLGPEADGGRCGWAEDLDAFSSRTLGWRLILLM